MKRLIARARSVRVACFRRGGACCRSLQVWPWRRAIRAAPADVIGAAPGVTFANSLADCEDDAKLSELDDASANLLEEIDQLEEALEVPDPEQQVLSGAIVTIGRDGTVEIERGRLRPQDVKRFRRASSNSEQQERAAPRTHG